MKLTKIAREKLVEKDIEWKQVYTDKTLFLKEQFEDVVGPGSYFRFEGADKGSDSEYYCIIGPAKIHDPIAKFFAGVRKLPATYSAGGKYFDSLDAAASYARDTWGVPTPNSLRPYTASSLRDIKKKVDKWKDAREEAEDKEASSVNKLNKTAEDFDNFPLNDLGDSGAISDQMRAKPENQKAIPTEKAQDQTMKDIETGALRSEEMAIMEKYPNDLLIEDLLDELSDSYEESELASKTGVAREGTLSWDDRTTLSNTSEDRPTVLDLILMTDDLFSRNPQVEGLSRPETIQVDGKTRSVRRITVTGKGNRYLPQTALDNYHDLLRYVKVKLGIEKKIEGVDGKPYVGDTTEILDGAGGQVSNQDLMDHIDMGGTIRTDAYSDKRKKQVFSNVIKNLIGIAKEQDDTGNFKHAEEIHRVIRKYRERIS